MRRALSALLILMAVAAPVAFASYPTHVRVSLTRLPGNLCCPKAKRAVVSATGVLTASTRTNSGTWQTKTHRRLSASELKRLRTELARFNPASLEPNNSAGCHGAPIGDVGGNDLRVGTHESTCPPSSADRLIKVLAGWLPR